MGVFTNPTIRTVSGRLFDPRNPEDFEYTIEDIAHSLSHQCRYIGHCSWFYSVADHSIMACQIIRDRYPDRPDLALEALLHDASEAFLTDVASPIKALLPDYQQLESRIQKEIAKQFRIPHPMSPEVHLVDKQLLVAEMKVLFGSVIEGLPPIPEPQEPIEIYPDDMDPDASYILFLKLFRSLRRDVALFVSQ